MEVPSTKPTGMIADNHNDSSFLKARYLNYSFGNDSQFTYCLTTFSPQFTPTYALSILYAVTFNYKY